MPEFPDIVVYQEHLAARLTGDTLRRIVIASPFVLRSVAPAPADLVGRRVERIERIGKRIVIAFDGDAYIVIHLMIAGRLQWRDRDAKPFGRAMLAAFEFERGTLYLTEAGTKRRASIHLVDGRVALAAFDPGGLDLFAIDAPTFTTRLRAGNHTVKRALTDPRIFSGIGNSYSDEILHRARLSPFAITGKLDDATAARLHEAAKSTLTEWAQRLRDESDGRFPDKVTAFRPQMAVHGRYGQPCPDCAAPVQRIVYADNEANYCARCQTGDRILADRALSRLLHDSFPKTLDDLG